MPDPDEAIDYFRMMSAPGSMLALWARIEGSFEDKWRKLAQDENIRAPHRISNKIQTWQNLATDQLPECSIHRDRCEKLAGSLRQALGIRNMICHGFRGANAGTAVPATLTAHREGIERTFTWNELQAMFSFLAHAPRAIAILSDAKDMSSLAWVLPPEEWLPEWSDVSVPDAKP